MINPKKINHKIHAKIARIDSPDRRLIVNIREYLEKEGIIVVVNRTPSLPVNYHLVFGPGDFVKRIFASTIPGDEERLVTLFSEDDEEAKDIAEKFHAKVWIANDDQTASRRSSEMFAYFRQKKGELADSSINLEPSLKSADSRNFLKNISAEEVNYKSYDHRVLSSPTSDSARVSQTMASIFGYPARNKKNILDAASSWLFNKNDNAGIKKIEHRPNNFSKRKLESGRLHRRLNFLGSVMSVFLFLIFFSVAWYFFSIGFGSAALVFGGHLISDNATKNKSANFFLPDIFSGTLWVGNFFTRQADGVLGVWEIPFNYLGIGEKLRAEENYVSFMSDAASLLKHVSKLPESGSEILSLLLPAGSQNHPGAGNIAIKVENIKRQVIGLSESLGLAGGRLELLLSKKPTIFHLPVVESWAEKLSDKFSKARNLLSVANNLLLLYPDLAGFRQKKIYLIILQNSMELRPTGGFIGSLAEAVLSEGKISDLLIQDVYAVDGQLHGHVDPPTPLRDLMGAEHWYLRDANWDPDFSESARRIAWFYQKETGTAVDGVIALNLPFVVDLLKLTGPIPLADYNDEITADNFFTKSLAYTQKDFFPGSTQKKDFLGSLTQALLNKLTSGGLLTLPRAVVAALGRRDILLYFNDPEAQRVVNSLSWSGALATPTCEGLPAGEAGESTATAVNCLPDALNVVEANLGVNKVNYYIHRNERLAVDFDEDGREKVTETLSYRNGSLGDTPGTGGGTYLNYLRFLVPADVTVENINLDGGEVPIKAGGVPRIPYVEMDAHYPGFNTIALAMTIAPGQERIATLSYRRNKQLPSGRGIYELKLGAQPGWGSTPRDILISYPAGWRASPFPSRSENAPGQRILANSGSIRYNSDSATPQSIRIQFNR